VDLAMGLAGAMPPRRRTVSLYVAGYYGGAAKIFGGAGHGLGRGLRISGMPVPRCRGQLAALLVANSHNWDPMGLEDLQAAGM